MLARRAGAKLAATLFSLAAILLAVIAFWNMRALQRFGRQHDVVLSLRAALFPHDNGGGPQAEKSVSYGTAADGTRLMLDVWRVAGSHDGGVHPAIVRIHGGAWIHGARSELWEWDKWLNQLGYEAFEVEYRMPPPERWRDEVGDVKCAIG